MRDLPTAEAASLYLLWLELRMAGEFYTLEAVCMGCTGVPLGMICVPEAAAPRDRFRFSKKIYCSFLLDIL
jgi:hypothetical protein